MVLVTHEKLLIEIVHPCPKDFVHDLKLALISVLQNREISELTDLEELKDTNFVLLELVRCLIQTGGEA